MDQSLGVSEATPEGERALTPRQVWLIFAGLMLGMLVAAISMSVVAPAMPRIVADLGGIDHYSWIALSAMLASTVFVPIFGKLSDLYGRKPFYLGGLVAFMAGSVLSGLSPSFWFLVGARLVQGLGMAILMPLSQAIIGDIVSPRERGKYQGLMGGVFGLSSIAGPFLGGWITDQFGWRWLFFVNVPIGLAALYFVARYMHLPQERRLNHTIDYAGFMTLTLGLTSGLLATSLGGTQYPWASIQVIGLFGFAAVCLTAFAFIEGTAVEPVLPPRLWANRVFTLSNVATMMLSMGMFGAIFFIPVFAQGVLGVSVTNSGALTVPMSVAMIGLSTLNGLAVSRTGHYKPQMILGLTFVGFGFFLLTGLDAASTYGEVLRDMVLIGAGLGLSMQTFTLVVQNAVPRQELGVATSIVQFSRSVGSAVGVAVLGTIMTTHMRTEIPRHLPPEAGELFGRATSQLASRGAGAVLDPTSLAGLPPSIIQGVREGLAAALHPVFQIGIPFVIMALIAAALVPNIPLRTKAHVRTQESEAG